jgi:formamidopyrimidine-DNA glycosylase
VSVEFPEAQILARQMNRELVGKEITACDLQNCRKFQDLGFINMYLSDFQRLVGCSVESVVSRGNTIRLKLDSTQNMLLAPEYGGVTLFHSKESAAPAKHTMKISFTDKSAITVTLTGMGIIQAFADEDLANSYVYRRDFSDTPSPLDADFTINYFSKKLENRGVNIKAAIVGKDAAATGLGNASFQDILYRAAIHPKHKASDLTKAQQQALFDAVQLVVRERIKLGGKDQFKDLYGRQGAYTPAMGPNMKGKICSACGQFIEKLSLGGGQVYFCPNCQK